MNKPKPANRFAAIDGLRGVAMLSTLFCVVFCASLYYLSHLWHNDDAYITYDFARSFAQGHGFRFTATAANPVYGSTTPLYVMLLALAHNLGIYIPTASTFIQAFSWAGLALVTALICIQTGQPITRSVAIGLVSTIAPQLWTASAGMETALFVLLVAVSLYAVTSGRLWMLAVSVALCALVRPEGYLIALLAGCGVLITQKQKAIYPLLLGISIVSAWLIYAHMAFGSIIPNTILAKMAYMHGMLPPRDKLIAHFSPFGNPWLLVVLFVSALIGIPSFAKRHGWIAPAAFVLLLVFYAAIKVPAFLWYWVPIMWFAAVFAMSQCNRVISAGICVLLVASAFQASLHTPPSQWPSIDTASYIRSNGLLKPGATVMTWSPGAYAGSVGYNTVDIVDNYVRNQADIHQTKLQAFIVGSPAL